MTDLHSRIDQMLTEARVILPGVQAMLGFQLIVFMTHAFEKLPRALQILHLGGLVLALITITLLIAPAAVHRMAFHGNDDARFHQLASRLLNVALIPLALSIAVESFIAAWKLTEHEWSATLAAAGVLTILIGTWYVFPLLQRGRSHGKSSC